MIKLFLLGAFCIIIGAVCGVMAMCLVIAGKDDKDDH